ncbi:MAG: muconolactone Delta-isomerase family protein [Acidimicrobiia bacterium]
MALYFIRFDVHQPEDMTSQQLTDIWDREAQAALGAIQAGAIKGLWKVGGQRTVLAIVDLPDSRTVDQALAGLPIVVEMGGSVDTECLAIYPYEEFAEDLAKAASGA